jgi:uncharacterized protein (DUF58 family)
MLGIGTKPRRGRPSARPDSTPKAGSDGVHIGVQELIALRLAARKLPLGSRRPALAIVAGGHRSPFRGRGMDYQESRNYQAGDDIRHMDWRVTARSDRPHIKLYREERERPVVVLADLSPSMFFATRGSFKSVVAARAAALIAWAAAHNGDRIGALLSNGGHRELRPRAGRRGAMHLIRALAEACDPSRGSAAQLSAARAEAGSRDDVETGLTAALGRLRRVARPGSLVVMIGDFYTLDEAAERHLGRLRLHNDLLALQVLDPLELAPPPPGRYAVTDGRRGMLLEATDRGVRSHYEDWFRARHRELEERLRRHAVPLLRLTTEDDVAEVLRRSLVAAAGNAPLAAPGSPSPAEATA